MRHECGPYLSTRAPFLLPAELPYDDLLRSPEGFTGRPGKTSGCTFGSVEGRETPRGHVLSMENSLRRGVFARHPLARLRPTSRPAPVT
jgi:hypothetical protein